MLLYHFSDDPTIETFVPREVRVPSPRPAGREWLNGPLVWAIEDQYDFLYHFPRNCPRILIWPKSTSSEDDCSRWLGEYRAAAYIESNWLPELSSSALYRYQMPTHTFETLNDAGMWVSQQTIRPLSLETIGDLPATFHVRRVDLRIVDSLVPLRTLWNTTLHVSGIRLRNAQGWV